MARVAATYYLITFHKRCKIVLAIEPSQVPDYPLIFGLDTTKKRDSYAGEAYLCSPDGFIPGMQTSVGLMQLYLHSEVKSVAMASDFLYAKPNAVIDSFCRQLGFSEHDYYFIQSATGFKFEDCER